MRVFWMVLALGLALLLTACPKDDDDATTSGVDQAGMKKPDYGKDKVAEGTDATAQGGDTAASSGGAAPVAPPAGESTGGGK